MKPRINEVLESFRDFVTTHDYQRTPISTAYVDVDPTNPDNQRERPAWLIELKNETKATCRSPSRDRRCVRGAIAARLQ